MTGNTKSDAFSYRPKKEHAPRIADLIKAVGFKKAHILDVALTKVLPELEKKYAEDLAALREKRLAEVALNESSAPINHPRLPKDVSYIHPSTPRPASSTKDSGAGKDLKQSVAGALRKHLRRTKKENQSA